MNIEMEEKEKLHMSSGFHTVVKQNKLADYLKV